MSEPRKNVTETLVKNQLAEPRKLGVRIPLACDIGTGTEVTELLRDVVDDSRLEPFTDDDDE